MSAEWALGKLLGEGANGKAFLAHRKEYLTGGVDMTIKYVIKQVFIGEETVLAKSKKLRETQLLAMIRHPYIVQYEDSFVEDGHLFVVMEFAGGGTLERYTEPAQCKLPCHPTMIKSLFVQMALAVAYLHDRKIVHRDLKPANVFLREDGCVKLGDLGEGWLRDAGEGGIDPAARWENDPAQRGQIVGTPYYLAPECWQGKCKDADKADVWALGVTLYELCTLCRPWDAKSIAGLAQRICLDPYRPVDSAKDPALMDAVAAMLVKDPAARLSCREVLGMGVFERAMRILHVPEHEWDPTFGKEAPRQAMPPASFLFQWGLRSFRPQCVEALLHKNIKQVSIGRYHIAAVSIEGELFTWSMITGGVSPDNAHAGLGHGSSAMPSRFPRMVRSEENEDGQVLVLHLDDTLFVSVACGDRFTVAVTSQGHVMSWGVGARGQLGHGEEKQEALRPRRISPPLNAAGHHVIFMDVAAGPEHALALTTEGEVYSWGCGESGRTGLGHDQDVYTPTKVRVCTAGTGRGSGGGRRLTVITEGGNTPEAGDSSEETSGSTPKCSVWFPTDEAQTGGGDQASPLLDGDGLLVVHVSCGEEHSAAVTIDGCLYVWGSNEVGQLGVDVESLHMGEADMEEPSGDFVNVPVKVCNGFPSSSTVIDVACGARHTVALLLENDRVSAYAWGEGMGLSGEWRQADKGGDDGTKFFANIKEGDGGMYNSDDDYADSYDSDALEQQDPRVPTLVEGPCKEMSRSEDMGVRQEGHARVGLDGWGSRLGTVSAGNRFCAALSEDFKLHMWGVGDAGQLGYQAPSGVSCRPQTVDMPLPLAMQHVACGTQTAFAVGMPKTEEAIESLGRVVTAEIEQSTALARGRSSKNLMV